MCNKQLLYCILTVLLIGVCPVQAQVASESFDYPLSAALNGQTGGIGWSGPWVAAATSWNIRAGLDVPSLNNEVGNCAYIGYGNSTPVTRPISATFGNETWFMFIVGTTSLTLSGTAEQIVFEGGSLTQGYGVQFHYWGTPNNVFSVNGFIGGVKSLSNVLIPTSSPLLVVGKVVKDTGSSTLTESLWLNPVDLANLGSPNLTYSGALPALAQSICIRTSVYDMLLDEIRIGSSAADLLSLGFPFNPAPANGYEDVKPDDTQFCFDIPTTVYPTDPNFFIDPNFPAGTYDVYLGVASEPNYAEPYYGLAYAGSGTAVYGSRACFTRTGANLQDLTNYYWCVVLNGDGISGEIVGQPWKFKVSTNYVPTVSPVNIYAVGDPNAIVTLNGYASDFDNQPAALTYLWTQVSGTSVLIDPNNIANPSVLLPIGDYEFRLTVSDSADTATGNVKVAVRATACEAAKANPDYYTNIKEAGDINNDCEVDIDDLTAFVQDWLE